MTSNTPTRRARSGTSARGTWSVAKTADRSVLGCKNDLSFLREVAITDANELAQGDLGGTEPSVAPQHQQHRGYRPRSNSPPKGPNTATESTGKPGRARSLPGTALRDGPCANGGSHTPEPPLGSAAKVQIPGRRQPP